MRAAVALVGVLCLGLAVRLFFFGGLSFGYGYDDGRYATVAANLARGYVPEGPTEGFGSRLFFLWPVAGLMRLAGVSDYTAVAWPLVGSMLGILAAYLVGTEIARRRVGLLAAAIMALAPLEVIFATRLRPDAWMPALVGVAVWAALRARRSERPWAWAVAAGATLAVAVSVRESALFMLPVVIAAAWPAGWRARVLVPVPALLGTLALGLVVAALGVSGNPASGQVGLLASANDPLTRWHATVSYAEQLLDGAFWPGSAFFLLAPVLIVALGVVVWRRPRGWGLALGWLAWAAVYLEGATLLLIDKATRYATLASIPASLVVALAVLGGASRVGSRSARAARAPGGASLWRQGSRDVAMRPLPAPPGASLHPRAPGGMLRRMSARGGLRVQVLASALVVVVVGVACLMVLTPRLDAERRDHGVVRLNAVAEHMRTLPPGVIATEDYQWWAKLRVYLARERMAVPATPEIILLTRAERNRIRSLTPLPDPAAARGGYVIAGPVVTRAGWPRNWSMYRQRLRAVVPWDQLVLVARLPGDVHVFRWPAGVPARIAPLVLQPAAHWMPRTLPGLPDAQPPAPGE